MSAWLIAGVGVVYSIIAIQQFAKGSVANGIVFTGYAFSNIGLWMVAK